MSVGLPNGFRVVRWRKDGVMSAGDLLRGGEPIEWVGADYVEHGVRAVTAGAHGKFVTTDGDLESDGVVVSFDPVGAFCCRREDIRRLAAS